MGTFIYIHIHIFPMYGDRLKYYFSKAYPPHGNLLFGILEKWAKKIAAIGSQRCGSHD